MQFEAIDASQATQPGADAPHVAFFSNHLGDVEGHGLARYSHELLAAVRRYTACRMVPVAGWTSFPKDAFPEVQARLGLELTGLGRRGTSLAWTFLDWPRIETCLKRPFDVVHAASLGYPIATRRPYVVTVHDLGPLTQPQFFSATRPWVMERSLKQAVDRAARIICVSQSTADEVRDYVGPGIGDRLRVIYEGVAPEFFDAAPTAALERFDLPKDRPFVLSAGKVSPRKNLQGLLEAMARVKDTIPHDLVLVGGAGWDTDVFQSALDATGLRSRVRVLGFVSDTELHALYQAADVYVQPSLYEGFGLPVLEAMAAGAPVIASNATSLPEVAGDAATLADATDADAMGHAIAQVCLSPERRANMRARGRDHAATFTWERCARQTAELYGEVRDDAV